MKKLKLGDKIKIIGITLASLLGFNINNANTAILPAQTNMQNSKMTTIDKITEQTPLFLYHANKVSFSKNNKLIAYDDDDYSHYSHSSHVSHSSHYSHYSSSY